MYARVPANVAPKMFPTTVEIEEKGLQNGALGVRVPERDSGSLVAERGPMRAQGTHFKSKYEHQELQTDVKMEAKRGTKQGWA